jgi:hypothetical protein
MQLAGQRGNLVGMVFTAHTCFVFVACYLVKICFVVIYVFEIC